MHIISAFESTEPINQRTVKSCLVRVPVEHEVFGLRSVALSRPLAENLT